MTYLSQPTWPELTSFTNLLQAYRKAARGKRGKASVAGFELHLEENLLALQDELRSGAYQPGRYDSFCIHEPKKRLISAAPFRDRVVHHALINLIEPVFERKFIYDTYANRKGKGTHKALDRCTHYLRRFKYVLPLDVRQFFPSIDHEILLSILANTITDPHILALCGLIIAGGRDVVPEEYHPVYFPGDDLFAILRPRGLPIGNLTSQFWGNLYLNGLDHFIKRRLKCRGYVRYVDDVLLFADTKVELHTARHAVLDYLAGLRLVAHENRAQLRPTRTGVPFLGFQVFPTHRRLKRRKVINARRKLKALAKQYAAGRIEHDRLLASLQGWANHARYGDTWGLRKAILRDVAAYLSF